MQPSNVLRYVAGNRGSVKQGQTGRTRLTQVGGLAIELGQVLGHARRVPPLLGVQHLGTGTERARGQGAGAQTHEQPAGRGVALTWQGRRRRVQHPRVGRGGRVADGASGRAHKPSKAGRQKEQCRHGWGQQEQLQEVGAGIARPRLCYPSVLAGVAPPGPGCRQRRAWPSARSAIRPACTSCGKEVRGDGAL